MKYQLKIPRKDTAVPGRKFSLKRQIVRAGWLFILVIALLLLILQDKRHVRLRTDPGDAF